MCGIVGKILARSASEKTRELLDVMRDTMRHRGPDDAGSWWSPNGRVGLAQRRLSIIDLSPAGHQPMLSQDGEIALTFNGEIYNFQALRDELAGLGTRFRSKSDTEVLLEAYRTWGVDCLDKLEGMFALGLYDANDQTLLIARDRAGEKPLFYRHDEQTGTFAFASELKALLADPECPRKLDRDGLNHYLAFGYVPGQLCMLEGLRKLPQGQALQLDLSTGQARTWVYWKLPSTQPPDKVDENELLERFHLLLRDSVRRRLVADVPVGILLSGGIDSSLVTALAAEVSARPVKTFTISFPGHRQFDEGPYARIVAEHFGTEHTELVAQQATVDLLPDLARQFDEPLADSSMVPTFLVSQMIRQHATVALGGDGGDELFGGYPGHSWVQQMACYRRWLPGPLRSALLPMVRRLMPVGKLGRNFALGLLQDSPHAIAQINMFFDCRDRGRILSPGLAVPPSQIHQPEEFKLDLQKSFASPLQKITAMDFQSYMVDDILVKVDRASMLTSLEIRAPFLDRAVIEFAFSQVPDSLRATRNEKKIFSRRLAAKLLPSKLDLKRKQGFSLPLQDWFQGQWGTFCQDVLTDARSQIFRPEAVDRLFAEQRSGRLHTQRLFAMTMLELWRREYKIEL